MARRIVALDIGSRTLKAAVIESSLRRCRVVGVFQYERELERPLAAQLRDFRAMHPLRADTVVSCLPGDAVSVRFLELPFTRTRQLQQTAPFELGNHIPFELDAVVVDFSVTQRTASGTRVLAIAVPRTILTEHLEDLAAAGFDPTYVGVASLAPLTLLHLAQTDLQGVTAMLDLGAQRASVALLHDGVLYGLRTLSIGLNDKDGYSALIQQLRWTLLASSATETLALDRVILHGGGSRASLLCQALAQALTAPILPLQEMPIPGIPPSWRSAQGGYAVCLGLALHEALGQTTPAVNLRQGAFTHQGQREAFRSELSRLGWLTLEVAAAAGLAFAIDMQRLNARYDAVRQEIRRVFTATLPDVHTIVNEQTQLRDAVEALQSRQHLLQGSSSASPLELLRQLSAALPEQLTLDLDEWTFDPDAIRLRGSTTSFDATETIKTTAANLGVFRDVQLKDVKMTAGGKKVAFNLQLILGDQKTESGRQ
jgi:general secretion pathway protein L